MQPNPDWGIELTLAVLEDLGWTRDRAPKQTPCAKRVDCLLLFDLEHWCHHVTAFPGKMDQRFARGS